MKRVLSHFGIAVFITVMVISLAGCMSLMMKAVGAMFEDYGVFDSSVPADQQSELKVSGATVTSFNNKEVSWDFGYVKVPAGRSTIVFNWTSDITNKDPVDYNSVRGPVTRISPMTVQDHTGITFSNVQFLAGHKYSIEGGKGADGQLMVWISDQTYTPMGLNGDVVANPPKASKTPTKLEGTWKNRFDETFTFAGNSWTQTIPPLTGGNTTSNVNAYRGTFEDDGEYITFYLTEGGTGDGKWGNIKSIKAANIWRYSLNNNNLSMELPYQRSRMEFTKQ